MRERALPLPKVSINSEEHTMSKLNKGLTITAVTAALAGSIGFAHAQSSSTGQGSAANPSTTTNGTVSTPNASGMSTTTDNSGNTVNSPNNSSTNVERGTGATANDGLNTMPAPAAGTGTSGTGASGTNSTGTEAAPAPMTPERPPRADRN